MTVQVLGAAPESAVLLDSPHSGSDYPESFGYSCDLGLLRRTEDAHVDRLFGFAPADGVTLVKALFPRSFIDANRACDDLDPLLLEESHAGVPSEKSRQGMGLVWRLVDGRPIYPGPITRTGIQARIDHYWQPYRDAVLGAWDRITARHGFGIHLNCHSMPSASPLYPPALGGVMPYDFIIGTRDGSTAGDGLAQLVVRLLAQRGYKVGLNTVFKGVELVRLLGDPAHQRHSLQIEINKRLYMDEASLQTHAGFTALQDDLRVLVRSLAGLSQADLRAL